MTNKCTDHGVSDTEDVYHERVVRDQFATVPGVVRHVPGDCYCLDCREPIPAWYNAGHPKIIK